MMKHEVMSMRWRARCGLLVALVLVMVSVAASAGSQTFVNDTGETATGIVITFSTQALITWNDGKLPAQTPDGMSDSFTFSGGSIEPGAGFMISWGPDSASVVDYQWLTKEETTTTPPENLRTVGNNLPGPDEPLYQPQPDEEMWLTDAEGHAVIYDNDSIKLNFAPGFDQSQIERIVWYRNGIRMRFVNPEDKVQLLTNALMKTFDGNPLEHSPASAHTDHAIAGYDYKVEIHFKDGGLLKILQTTVESTFKWHPKEVWAQLDISWYWDRIDGFSDGDIVQSLTHLKHDGFTGISVDIPYYVMAPSDSEILEVYGVKPGISNWDIQTPTTSELEKLLKTAKEVGIDVHIRGHLYISQEYQDEHGFAWSGVIEPNNPSKFFENYGNLLMKILPLLDEYDVKLFTPFTEMDGIEKYPDLIKKMYDRLSKVFPGELGLEEETHMIMGGNSFLNNYNPIHTLSEFQRLAKNLTFWNWTNPEGNPMRIEYSGWIIQPKETQTDQRVSVIEKKYIETWSLPTSYYSSTYPSHSQMWGEIGAMDFDGYVLGPAYYERLHPETKNVPDEQERSDVMYAVLKASKKLGIDLINQWTFSLEEKYCDGSEGFLYTGFGQLMSPAYRVIKAIIGSN